MKGLQVDDGRNRNRDPLLLGPKNALARRPLVTMRPFDRCTVVAVVIQRANIGLIMKNSIHGIEIPFPTTTRRRSSLQCELLGDLANRPALLRIEIKDSANHHRLRLGAEIGFFSGLHTWSQKLELHPHVHCVVPAGGLSLDHTHWVRSRYAFFLPVKVLSRIFRGKFVAALKSAFRDGQLQFHGDLAPLAQPKTFSSWLRPLFRKDWVVHSKRPFGGPQHVLHYLGRYTHRVAISNHRLISLSDGKVTFRWSDSAHNNEQKLMALSLDEFLRRFLLHLLPEGFVRIRNFGFLANRKRATNLPLSFQLLGRAPQTEQEASTAGPSDLWSCPKCGRPMMVIERLAPSEIQLRSPPLVTAAA